MVTMLIWVGVGGFLGSGLRYILSWLTQHYAVTVTFPLGTLAANCLSCFVVGVIAQLIARSEIVSPEMRLFLATGFCGGLSTLSSVVYEVAQLIKDRELLYAAGYFTITCGGAFLCFLLGLLMVQFLLKN